MAENLNKKPSKGILKNSSSFDTPDAKLHAANRAKAHKEAKWDEMNIMATLHPAGKDYGHMKIDEPKTPYNYEGLGLDVDELDADALAAKIRAAAHETPKALRDSDESEDDETPEEKAARKEFEQKRKKHYNEFYAVKLARKLLEKEADEDDDDDKQQHQQQQQQQSSTDPKRTPCIATRTPKKKEPELCTTTDVCHTAARGKDACEEARACFKSKRCGCLEAVRKM